MLKKSKFLIFAVASILGLTACSAGTTTNNPNPDGEPTKEDKYLVSQDYWTSNITQGGYFGSNHNLTLNMMMTNNSGQVERGTLANQNGKLHVQYNSEGDDDFYVEPLSDSTYNIYAKEDGEWAVTNLPETYFYALMGSFTVFINPWKYSDFTYNEETHAYEKASDEITLGEESVTATNIVFKFEDSKLLSLTFTASQREIEASFSLTVSNWGTTVVTLPTVGGDPGTETTTITLSEVEINLEAGDKAALSATILPEDKANLTVTWTSSDPDIAEVERTGADTRYVNIKGHMEGTAIITATIEDGISATCKVNVTGGSSTPIPASSIVISQNNLSMKVGDEVVLSAEVYPANATNKLVHWSTEKKGVINIVQSGDNNSQATITAIGVGTCEITAIVTLGVEARCQVTVSSGGSEPPVVQPTKIQLSPTELNLKVGENALVNATILPEDATNKSVSWSSESDCIKLETQTNNNQVKVHALKEGSASLVASTSNGLKASCTINISKDQGGGQEETPKNELVNVTLKYKEFFGPLDYGEEELTNAQVDEIMGDVYLSIFEGTYSEGAYLDCEFEYYHKTNPMKGAYLGSVTVYEGQTMGGVNRYYNFETNKFSFGSGISYRNIISVYGDLRVTYISEEKVEEYQVDGHEVTAGMYAMEGYLMDSNGKVSGKGFAVFEKVDDSPVRLSDIPSEYSEPVLDDIMDDKLFVYDSYETDNPESGVNAKLDEEQQNASIAFFEDGTFEYHVYKKYISNGVVEDDAVYRGQINSIDYSSDEEPVYGDETYYLFLKAVDVVKNGEVTPLRAAYFTFYYSASENAVYRYRENETFFEADESSTSANVLQKFALSSEKPQKYEVPGYDNWDAEGLAAALSDKGYSDTLPKMDNVKVFDIRDNGEDSIILMLGFATPDLAIEASDNYASVLRGTFTPVSQYDSAAGSYVLYYVSPNGQYKIEWHNTTGTNYVQVTIKNAEVKYPTSEINNYLISNDISDTLPELKVDGAFGYDFYADANALYINIDSDKVNAAIASVTNTLLGASYTKKVISGNTFFVSPNNQIGVKIVEQANGIGVAFIDPTTLPETAFPTEVINAYLAGVTDAYPSFAHDGDAIYAYDGPSGVYVDGYLTIKFENPIIEEEYLNTFIPSLCAKLEGYTMIQSLVVTSPEGNSRTYGGTGYLYLSPNQQVAIRIVPSNSPTWMNDESGSAVIAYNTYAIQYINLVTNRLTSYDDGLPHLDAIRVSGMTTTYVAGSEFSFDGVCTAIYTNGGENKVVTPTSVSSPDMSEEGRQEVVVSYTEDGVTKEAAYYINIIKAAELVELTFRNTDDFDIFSDRAQFKIWAWGGEYGRGQWVEISSINQETRDFVFSLYDNCDGFIIVRLNPDEMPTDTYAWDIEAWNQTGTLNIATSEEGYITFVFLS